MLLSESPHVTPIHRRILALAFCGWMFDFYDLILYTFLIRPITADLGLTHMDHAQALAITFAATAIGGIASGVLADRFGRRTMVSWTILLYSLGSLLCGLAPSKAWLLAARVITGLGGAGSGPPVTRSSPRPSPRAGAGGPARCCRPVHRSGWPWPRSSGRCSSRVSAGAPA